MQASLIGQSGSAGGDTLSSALTNAYVAGHDRLDVATAYLTISGIQTICDAINPLPTRTRWIVGLDDYITQPTAIRQLISLDGAEVRLANLSSSGRRFHPKIYRLWSTADVRSSAMLIGSGNMTSNGLERNAEAATLLRAETNLDANAHGDLWAAMWELGSPSTSSALQDYTQLYRSARQARARIENLANVPSADEEDVAKSPSSTLSAWLDIGSATAQGREIELPKAMTPFFGVLANGADALNVRFRLTSGAVSSISLRRREDNGMWRLGFRSETIVAAIGRPTFRPDAGTNRSDLAAVFEWSSLDEISIAFTPIGSGLYQQLLASSDNSKQLFRTTGSKPRLFGFI